MNFCPYCGTKLNQMHKFCPSCGAAVPENKEAKKDDPEIEEVSFKSEEKQAPKQEPNYQQQYQDPASQRITYEYIVGGQRNNTYSQGYNNAQNYQQEPRYQQAPQRRPAPVINNKREMTLAFVFSLVALFCAIWSDTPIIALFLFFPGAMIFRSLSIKNYKKYISLGNPDVGLAKASKIINKISLPLSIAFLAIGIAYFVYELVTAIQNGGGSFEFDVFFYNLFGDIFGYFEIFAV